MTVIRVLDRELLALCRCGPHGVIAAGIIVTALLYAPFLAVMFFVPR